MPTTPSSKTNKSFKELIAKVKFNPDTVVFKPDQKAVERLLRKHGLSIVNIKLIMEDIEAQGCADIIDIEGYIENMAYYASQQCKYCYNKGCRICLGIDL